MIQADGELIKYNVIVNELIMDNLLQSYREFTKKAEEMRQIIIYFKLLLK